MLSRVCEEFHCTPSVAARELDADPEAIFELLGLRAYAAAKAAYDAADTAEKQAALPAHPLIDLVRETEFEIVRRDGTDPQDHGG